jgi:hypothetical protein
MRLYEEGFQVIKKAITRQQADAMRMKANDIDKWATVFINATEQDEFHLQARIEETDDEDDPLLPIKGLTDLLRAAHWKSSSTFLMKIFLAPLMSRSMTAWQASQR